jgi:hypothetical protein
MIKPLKPSKPVLEISCFDIETAKTGKLLDIGYRHVDDYQTFKTWFSFLHHLFLSTEEPNPPRILWAHNGGKFDVVSMLMEIHTDEAAYEKFIESKSARLINGSILELQITFTNKETVSFRDSFRLFPMALNKVLKAFIGESKNDVPKKFKADMGEYKRLHSKAYYDYLRQDVDGLYKSLKKFRDLVNDISPIGDLPLSLGSLALKVFRTSFLAADLHTPIKKHQDFADPSYSGGRTEFFGMGTHKNNIYGHCYYYDYNSMYPAEMENGIYPIGPGTYTKTLEYFQDGEFKGELMPGCYQIEYEQTGGHIPLLRDQSSGKKSKEHTWSGSGTYTSDELEYLYKIGAEIKIIRGLVYPKCSRIFKRFIESFYALRMQGRADKNDALDLVAKLIMNNLYGKFGQREQGEALEFYTLEEVSELLRNIYDGKEQKIIGLAPLEDDTENDSARIAYTVKSKMIVPHRHVLIAALITARCRCRITSVAERYWQSAIYCDTDSFITQQQLAPELIDPNILGKLKPEYFNVDMEFWGRKQYRILNHIEIKELSETEAAAIQKRIAAGEETKIKRIDYLGRGKYQITPFEQIKQKGVKIENEEQFIIDVRTENGYYAEYQAPASIKAAMKKGMKADANEFKTYHRTIKADLSSKEKGIIKMT